MTARLGRASLMLAALLAIVSSLPAQSIFTVAGGQRGDLTPTAFPLGQPVDVTVDRNGNLYICVNDKVLKVSPGSGTISTLAGGDNAPDFGGDGGPAANASLNDPEAVAVDKAGNVYLADSLNNRIRKIDAVSGFISTVVGSGPFGFDAAGSFSGDGGPATEATIYNPLGMTIDGAGNLYIADTNNNRVRRVDASTGIITTVAGSADYGFGGDGGPATEAKLHWPRGLAVDGAGNLYIADDGNNRIRKVAAASGVITTVAGTGERAFGGDGGLAIAASMIEPTAVAINAAGEIFFNEYGRIRKVDTGGYISTYAGNGSLNVSGFDGASAKATGMDATGLSFDTVGNLYLSDFQNFRVRRVDTLGNITTVVGTGYYHYYARPFGFSGDGKLATLAELAFPAGVALDPGGNLYIADSYNHRIRKVAAKTSVISTIAGSGPVANSFDGLNYSLNGGYGGDGGPATAARLNDPCCVVADGNGNVYIADTDNNRVRKVSADGLISTIAGTGEAAFSGDGGPAAAAALNSPAGIALDAAGNLYVSDGYNNRVRKIAAATGTITTIAGSGDTSFLGTGGDGGPATAAALHHPGGMVFDAAGNLYIADTFNNRVRKVAANNGVITTVAGSGNVGPGNGSFSGDGGPAAAATLNWPTGVSLDGEGNLYIADGANNRIRKVDAATAVITTFAGTVSGQGRFADDYGFRGDGGPANAALLRFPSGVATDANGALFIADTSNSRIRQIPSCTTVSSPQPDQPANASSSVSSSPRFAWSAVNGAFHYDLYLDTVNPPRNVVAADVAAPTYSPANLEPLTTFYWKVVAKGDPFCPSAPSAGSAVSSFVTKTTCVAPGIPHATAAGSAGTATVQWDAAARASTYDLYVGSVSPPGLWARGLTTTGATITGLAPGTSYFWRVVAHASCDDSLVSETAVGSFLVTGACDTPKSFDAIEPAEGQSAAGTLRLSWQPSAGAASYDVYLGSDPQPALYLRDIQQTSVTVARLAPGSYRWKVTAKAACGTPTSASTAIHTFRVFSCATPAAPALLTSQAAATAGATYAIRWTDAAGADAGSEYLIERATDKGFSNIVDAQRTTRPSASFIATSAGTYYHRVRSVSACDDARRSGASTTAEVTVAAPAPTVVFSVMPRPLITALGDKLENLKTTFALENLSESPVQVLVGPQLTGSLPFFNIVDPAGGDAVSLIVQPHKPKTLEIHYSGPPNDQPGSYQGGIYVTSPSVPLAFTPQAYVNLKVGGNAGATAPRLLVGGVESGFAFFPPAAGDDSSRPPIEVGLANSGSLPLDVSGEIGPESWLKLEKDWNATAVPEGATRTLRLSTQRTKAIAGSALPRYTYLTVRNKAGEAARLLVEDSGGITNLAGRRAPLGPAETSAIVPLVTAGTSILITNSGGDLVPVDMIYTPAGSDGFDPASVLRAAIVIPPNDVVRLTDPLLQLFGKGADATGSLEILSGKLGQLAIRAEWQRSVSGGGVYGLAMPVALRGEGARLASLHRLAGIVSNAATKTSLLLSETSGRDKASVHAALFNNSGGKIGEQTIELGRYGSALIDDLAQTLAGGTAVAGGRVDVEVTSGGGSVVAVALVTDRNHGGGASLTARPTEPSTESAVKTFAIPGATTNANLITSIGISALTATANATIALRDSTSGAETSMQSVVVAAGQTSEVDIPRGVGTAIVTVDAPAWIHGLVHGAGIHDALPVVAASSEGLTGGGSATPLYADGLDHSIDVADRKTSLILTELAGQAATVDVRIYEPGNRSVPIAQKVLTVAANQELHLDNLFASMGLESGVGEVEQRRKNRINVAVVVTATGGSGLIAAQALVTDNATGDRRTIALVPVGNVPVASVEKPEEAGAGTLPGRRRSARH